MRRIFKEKAKSLPISKQQVWEAYKKVKSNKGSWGVDKVSIEQFDTNLENNLYKLWNRLALGSYFPPAVKEVEIPKANGKKRQLGIPTVSDRIGHQVIKDMIEPRLEREFHESSYGYRPQRSAHQALRVVENNTRKYDWVIDLDITKFFDTVNHEKLMLALDRHIEENWIKVYIKRWLEAPVLKSNGELEEKQGKGTPQGGVISPLLANLYLHYRFDTWMDKNFPSIEFVRYADDMIILCRTEKQALYVLSRIEKRLRACDLSSNPEKTEIVYCKYYRRKQKGHTVSFDFLGFNFLAQTKASKTGGVFLGYGCRVSKKNRKRMTQTLKDLKFVRNIEITLQDIANALNPKIRGWMGYYETFKEGSLKKVFRKLKQRLVKWAINKYKRFKGDRKKGYKYILNIRKYYPYIFYHWKVSNLLT